MNKLVGGSLAALAMLYALGQARRDDTDRNAGVRDIESRIVNGIT